VRLLAEFDSVPALRLVAQRPATASAGAALRGSPLATSIALSPLSSEATGSVLAEHGGAPVSASFARACQGATGGNPLLVHRLTEGLRDRGIDGAGDAGAEAVDRLGPYAVAGAVGAALARAGEGPVRLAHAVAVLDGAPLVTAARLAGVGSEQATAFGEQLVRAGLLCDVRPLEFEHALVRDAVLSGLSASKRARLHAEAARIPGEGGAAPEAIAVHLLHAEPRGDEAIAGALAEAGRRA
jgi:hypothetical protein